MLDTNTITIGDNCMFGPNVTLATATHPIRAAERVNPEGREYALPIRIGNEVWLGAGVTVRPGVTIGDGPWWPPARSWSTMCRRTLW